MMAFNYISSIVYRRVESDGDMRFLGANNDLFLKTHENNTEHYVIIYIGTGRIHAN